MSDIAPWIALLLFAGALVAASAALLARALFATSMYFAAAGALAASGMALLANGVGAFAVAIIFVAWAPLLLLGAVLLTTRTTKGQRARPWLSVGAACAVGAAVLWVTPELGAAVTVREAEQAAPDFVGAWIAPLLLVAALTCVGLIGYGERGALQRRDDDLRA